MLDVTPPTGISDARLGAVALAARDAGASAVKFHFPSGLVGVECAPEQFGAVVEAVEMAGADSRRAESTPGEIEAA